MLSPGGGAEARLGIVRESFNDRPLARALLFRAQCHQAAGFLGLVAPGEEDRFSILGKRPLGFLKAAVESVRVAQDGHPKSCFLGSDVMIEDIFEQVTGLTDSILGIVPK